MRVRCGMAFFILSASILAQSPPTPCPADRPVDDIIAEISKQQSKKKHRNTNPLPQVVCIFGWCHDFSRTPPTLPEPAPRVKGPSTERTISSSATDSSVPVEKCDAAMAIALDAAHNVDVGDYYFGQKNYNGALLRYNDALEEKPGDTAIHVRLGRIFEKLNQLPQAIEQYKEAQKLAGPKNWSNEASSSLMRLQRPPGS